MHLTLKKIKKIKKCQNGWDRYLFYEQSKSNKRAIFYKHTNGSLPNYLNEHLVINNTQHAQETFCSSQTGKKVENVWGFVVILLLFPSLGKSYQNQGWVELNPVKALYWDYIVPALTQRTGFT